MGRSIEIYTCVVVTAFLVEIVAIIIHGTPLALLAYAVTIVLVFTAIMVALNFHNRNNNDNDRDRSNGTYNVSCFIFFSLVFGVLFIQFVLCSMDGI